MGRVSVCGIGDAVVVLGFGRFRPAQYGRLEIVVVEAAACACGHDELLGARGTDPFGAYVLAVARRSKAMAFMTFPLSAPAAPLSNGRNDSSRVKVSKCE